jgi:hypothetical protein
VFSFAIIMYELFAKAMLVFTELPVGTTDTTAPDRYAEKVADGYRPRKPTSVHPDVWALVEDCWQQDPLERPSMGEVRCRAGWQVREAGGGRKGVQGGVASAGGLKGRGVGLVGGGDGARCAADALRCCASLPAACRTPPSWLAADPLAPLARQPRPAPAAPCYPNHAQVAEQIEELLERKKRGELEPAKGAKGSGPQGGCCTVM